jgi:hypothetical protein
MGAFPSIVGTSMAVKHAPSMGNSIVELPVISAISAMPVTGARTTPVKKAAIPTTAKATGAMSRPGKVSWHT